MIIFDFYNEIVSEEEEKHTPKEEKLKQKLLLEVLEVRESLQVININGEIVSQ